MNVNQALFYESSRIMIGPLISRLFHLRSEGAENVPKEGGALIVSNHRNPVLDPFSIALSVPHRQINFVALDVAFALPVVKQLFEAWGAFGLSVSGGKESKAGLEHAVELLREGELVGIFPEGVHTLAKPHAVSKIMSFRTGFARIALQAKVPIIPACVIAYGERNLPKIPPWLLKPFFDHPDFQNGLQWIYYKRAHVKIGKPIDISGLYGEEITKSLIDQLAGKVRRIIMKLYNGEDLDRFLTGEKP
ncbi:MAG: lysophospholipid acyltransferase family protein, partial [Actinomycetota bacterium]|nr:lysophospholipid acyltransferase family protein [Actinomycetota bacterium]